jgi:hypothetical protein
MATGTWCPAVPAASLMMTAAAVGATRTLDVLVHAPIFFLPQRLPLSKRLFQPTSNYFFPQKNYKKKHPKGSWAKFPR